MNDLSTIPTPEDATPPPLRDEIAEVIRAVSPAPLSEGDAGMIAGALMNLLNERGHYLPGCPPAAQLLKDAQQFAGQLMLAMLTVRVQQMLESGVETPETAGARRWLRDYVDGRNHGPVGKPMLWPGQLPGLAHMFRTWGYQPTPTTPQFVGRAPAPAVLNHDPLIGPGSTLN